MKYTDKNFVQQAINSIPLCVCWDPAQIKTPSDVRYILQHEIDLFEEGEDGALTQPEITQVRKALAKLNYAAI